MFIHSQFRVDASALVDKLLLHAQTKTGVDRVQRVAVLPLDAAQVQLVGAPSVRLRQTGKLCLSYANQSIASGAKQFSDFDVGRGSRSVNGELDANRLRLFYVRLKEMILRIGEVVEIEDCRQTSYFAAKICRRSKRVAVISRTPCGPFRDS